jgi:Gram-negative bacterial TonB protein C-terminal
MRIRGRSSGPLLFAGLLASASVVAAADPVACDPAAKGVVLVKPAAAHIDAVVWGSSALWELPIRFRVRADGSPEIFDTGFLSIVDPQPAQRPDKDVLKKVTLDAFLAYRFCPAPKADPWGVWNATMHFAPSRSREAYLQTFKPTYGRREVEERRQGTVTVRTRFALDGTPSEATVVTSSGDEVLDRQAVASSLNEVVVTRDGQPLEREYISVRPYSFATH